MIVCLLELLHIHHWHSLNMYVRSQCNQICILHLVFLWTHHDKKFIWTSEGIIKYPDWLKSNLKQVRFIYAWLIGQPFLLLNFLIWNYWFARQVEFVNLKLWSWSTNNNNMTSLTEWLMTKHKVFDRITIILQYTTMI